MRKLLVFIPLLSLSACGPAIEQQGPDSAILVRYDLSAGVIPLPNDLLRSADGTRLNVPIDPASSKAQQEFNAYLNTLSGFPATSPITIPMSGPISESTLEESTVPVL